MSDVFRGKRPTDAPRWLPPALRIAEAWDNLRQAQEAFEDWTLSENMTDEGLPVAGFMDRGRDLDARADSLQTDLFSWMKSYPQAPTSKSIPAFTSASVGVNAMALGFRLEQQVFGTQVLVDGQSDQDKEVLHRYNGFGIGLMKTGFSLVRLVSGGAHDLDLLLERTKVDESAQLAKAMLDSVNQRFHS